MSPSLTGIGQPVEKKLKENKHRFPKSLVPEFVLSKFTFVLQGYCLGVHCLGLSL